MLRSFWSRLTARASTPWVLAALLLLLPVLLALVGEARDGKWRSVPHSDEAVLQLHLRQAIHGLHLLGPYSQYDWYHPGPLYYYLLAPLYVLSGEATRSLFFSAGLIYGFALAATLAVHFALDRRTTTRFTFLALFAFTLAAFLGRLSPGGFDASPITDIWNPLVPVVPFVLALVVAAAVAVGRLELAPLLAFLQAFTAQTHVSYAPASTLLLFGALGAGFRAKGGRALGFRLRWGAITLGALVLFWLPPLIALVAGHYGNALELGRFALSRTRLKVPRGAAYGYAFRQLHWMILHPLHLSPSVAARCGGVLTALQLAGAVSAFREAGKRGERYLGWLAVAPLAMSFVALGQAPSLASLDEAIHYYQTLWYDIVGCFGWLGLALVACFAAERHARRVSLALVGLGYAAVAGYALSAVRRVHDDFALCRERARSEQTPPPLLALSVSTLLDHPLRGKRAAFNPVSANSWVTLATLALDFSKKGIELPINARWRFMYGTGAHYAPEDSPAVEISADDIHTEPLWRAFGDLKLYTDGFEQRFAPGPTDVIGEHVRGDPRRIVRDPVPGEGEPWDGADAVVLLDGSSSITLVLPRLSVSQLEIIADGNDDYAIEGTHDGSTFEPVGTIPNVGRKGLAPRTAHLKQRGPWRGLRIRPGRGDGSYSVAHVQLLDPGFDCTVIAQAHLRDDAEKLCDGATAPVGSPWDGPESVKLAGLASRVTVALPSVEPGAVVAGVELEGDGNDLYHVEASRNGRDFVEVGRTEGRLRFGIRWFPFYFNDFTEWTAVRLRPASGDGSLSLAEIRPLVTRGILLDVASARGRALLRDGWGALEVRGDERFVGLSGSRATLRVPLTADTDYSLVLRVRAPDRGPPVTISVELNQHPLLTARLPPGAAQTLSVALPSHFVAEANEVGLQVVEPRAEGSAPMAGPRLEFVGARFEPAML